MGSRPFAEGPLLLLGAGGALRTAELVDAILTWFRDANGYTRSRMPERGNRAHFATTRWSLVLAAGAAWSPAADEALAKLCETYWYPLYAFLRGRGQGPDDAQDLTQAFFLRLLEKKVLRHADPARGRFRSFLLTSLKNFAANERDREVARKRHEAPISIEIETAEGRFQREPPTDETPEKVFDRRWALTLLDRVLTRLRNDMARSNSQRFESLKMYLTGEQPQQTYAETAVALGISEGNVRVAVHRLRRQFRTLLREEIAHTLSTPEEIEDEIQHLWSAVKR
jgi:RNA polymerase sigma-70 factor (ECF subfamily)